MVRAPSGDVFGTVTLVTGPEEFLAERAVRAVVDAARCGYPEVEVTTRPAADVDPGMLADLTSPSLFASERVVVLDRLENIPAATAQTLVRLAGDPPADIALVLVHGGGQRGRAGFDKLRRAAVVVPVERPKAWDLPRFVVTEVRSARGRIDDEAAGLLVDAVGHDLRSLAAAAAQLVADSAGEPIDQRLVRRYFGGRAEVTSFAVADAALNGQVAASLEQLRWAMANGVPPVLVTSACAGGLRAVTRLLSAQRGLREADLAREVGVPAWKLRSLRPQARGWTPSGVARAVSAVASADADIKGAAEDAGYALERMVMTVASARGG